MSLNITEETLEEGRSALYQLERQLKDRGITTDNRSETSGSKQQSSASERRLLDQLPRMIRLNNRLESLGLTVEELDDRGLLDGGGSVPSYYTSLKQKNRRVLELQPRSHRLQERGKETLSKLLNAIFHMLRVLVKRGLQLEDHFRAMDVDKKGLIHKKQMLFILRQLGLPFAYKELQDITQQYCQPSSEKIDYISFLHDGRIGKKESGSLEGSNPDSGREGAQKSNENNRNNHDLSSFTAVLHEVKRMLYEAIRTLNKNFDEVYRMFARWDTHGSGTVTATQFLRVLARLHIELSDQDQDFLVELLDTNAMGRIDFESLLSYCFNEESPPNNPVGGGIIVGTAIGFDDNAGETLSAVSIDGNSVEQKSTTSGNLLKRPHTASISRPYTNNTNGVSAHHSQSNLSRQQPLPAVQLPAVNTSVVNANYPDLAQSSFNAYEERKKGDKNRPSTAVGNISSSHTNHQANDQVSRRSRGNYLDDTDGVLDLPDDVIHGEEIYLNNQQRGSGGYPHTSNDHFGNYGEESHLPPREVKYNQFFVDNTDGGNNNYQSEPSPIPMPESVQNTAPSDYDYLHADPIDHLILLANQILATLRDIILTRYRRGRGLREIYQHFDRENKGYFDATDFIQATSDLSIETSERVAVIAVKLMGIDSVTYVTYGEFIVFVLDSDHALLQTNVQEQLANLLEKQGREYQTWMIDIFQSEEESINDSRNSKSILSPSSMPPLPNHYHQPGNKNNLTGKRPHGFINKNAFISTLKKIGLNLTSSEITRLVDRFDIYGNEFCSIERFIRMVQTSRAWKHAEVVLTYQDKAIEEATYLREQKQQQSQQKIHINEIEITEELINMCEYLGICILTEQNMIWIAADALRAPLPVNWSAQKDHNGKTYFYNHLTNQSQWEHPLDPHFRNLRDKYRQSSEEAQIDRMNGGSRLPILDTSTGNNNNVNNNQRTQLFEKNNRPKPQLNDTEEDILEQYRAQSANRYNVPAEVSGKRKENTRPASAAIPEKITISFNKTGITSNGSGALNETMMSGLSSTDQLPSSIKNRPVSAPGIISGKKEEVAYTSLPQQNNKNHNNQPPSKLQSVTQNKVIMEAVYGAPYLKSAQLAGYQDTTQLADRQYYNNVYHNLPNPTGNASSTNNNYQRKDELSNTLFGTTVNTSNTTSSPFVNHPSLQQQTHQPQASSLNNYNNINATTTRKKAGNSNNANSQLPHQSAVDRALSIGKTSQQILQERDQLFPNPNLSSNPNNNAGNNTGKNRAAKLNEMLEGNIIEKLDYLITAKR